MTLQTLPSLEKAQTISFDDFIQSKPDDRLYELHEGLIVEMPQPKGKHEEIKGFLTIEFVIAFHRMQKRYFLPNQAFVRLPESESAYLPDILFLNPDNLSNEPLWERSSTVMQGATIPLVVEVVSTNWRVDYLTKLKDYEEIGIGEYWIVDYLGVGARRIIGEPKEPTVVVHELVDGEYQIQLFRGDERVISGTLPKLDVTANQIFGAN